MRRCAFLTALLVLAACDNNSGGGHAAAQCAAPYLDDDPSTEGHGSPVPTVSPGGSLTIYGHGYTSTCNDTGDIHDPLQPLPPVHLTMTLPGGTVERLGEFTPGGRDMGFRAVVRIPAATHAGRAKITDDRSVPAIFRFVVGGD